MKDDQAECDVREWLDGDKIRTDLEGRKTAHRPPRANAHAPLGTIRKAKEYPPQLICQLVARHGR
jgi:hypothetical protein